MLSSRPVLLAALSVYVCHDRAGILWISASGKLVKSIFLLEKDNPTKET